MTTRKKPTKAQLTPSENLVLIKISWHTDIILPFDEGMKFIDAMRNAEIKENNVIKHIDTTTFTVSMLSRNEYVRLKTAQLMGVDVDDLPDDLEVA